MTWKGEIKKNEYFLSQMKGYRQTGVIRRDSLKRVIQLVEGDADKSRIMKELDRLNEYLIERNNNLLEQFKQFYEMGKRDA